MENPSEVFAEVGRSGPFETVSPPPEHWHLARAAHVDLLLMGMPRVNLLLIAPDGVIAYVLESPFLDLHEPITRWSPGDRLVLPSPAAAGTMILHDVGALSSDDQLHLLEWLERAGGRTQVVSTSSTPLMTRVQAGAFIDTLYYRLNTVCVDVTA
jgi:hypothetical protein